MSHLPEFGDPIRAPIDPDEAWEISQQLVRPIAPEEQAEEDDPAWANGVWVGDAPEDEPDDPRPQPFGNAVLLRANTTPREAADMLRKTYLAEWIADLLVALLSRTAFTEDNP